MTSIGTTNYGNIISRALGSGSKKSQTRIGPGNFIAIKNIEYDPDAPKNDPAADERLEQIDENGVPMRWTSARLYNIDTGSFKGYTMNKDAFAGVKEKLEAEGIDADKRTPSHEITEEQMQWLSVRHDFDYLSECSISDPEFGNFILDLTYLNVFSFDEAGDLFGVMPFNANNRAILYRHGDHTDGSGAGFVTSDGSLVDDYQDLLAHMNMEYLKSHNAGNSESENEKTAAKLEAQRIERLSIITELFERFFENRKNAMDMTLPKVEDASNKLKEDFGKSV